jgi:chorismate mutase
MDCLDSLSRRIHFGKFVAESKFRSDREKYTKLIKARDVTGIDEAITNEKVEQMVLDRIGSKAETYGAPVLRYSQMAQGEITSSIIVNIYKDCVIPLTKKVEVDYLLRRLEWDDTA